MVPWASSCQDLYLHINKNPQRIKKNSKIATTKILSVTSLSLILIATNVLYKLSALWKEMEKNYVHVFSCISIYMKPNHTLSQESVHGIVYFTILLAFLLIIAVIFILFMKVFEIWYYSGHYCRVSASMKCFNFIIMRIVIP